MKRVLSKKQAAFIDSFTINNGTPELTLMERASEFVASEAESFLKANTSARILVVSGFGNNGGDAVCAARILISKYPEADITVALIDDKKISESLRYQIERLAKVENENGRISSLEVVPQSLSFSEWAAKHKDYDIIIDGLFGVGLKRDVTGRFSDAVDYINSQHDKGAKVIAVDIPSGIDGSTGQVLGNAVKADVTVTFGALKTGHVTYPGRSYAGTVKVCDIGFDELAYYDENFGCDMEVLDTNDTSFLPKRSPDSNKGTYGKVLVAAGCDDMPGACILSSKAALRCGAGLVSACSSEKVLNSLITVLPEAVLSPEEKYLKNNVFGDLFEKYDAVVLGPGFGRGENALKKADALLSFTKSYSESDKTPVFVLDADLLNILSDKMNSLGISSCDDRVQWLDKNLPKNSVLTPHKKELSRLLNISMEELKELVSTAEYLSGNSGLVWVLKDAATLITSPGNIYINTSGNNGMSTAGSGDVLTGIIAAFAAQGSNAYAAAKAGVYVHGLAGDYAKDIYSEYGVMASDMADAAAVVIKNLINNNDI